MNTSKEHVFNELKATLAKLFELNPENIRLDSHLYEELNLDSIDAIDLITHLQTTTGRKFNPEEFKSVRTLDDVVNIIVNELSKQEEPQGA